MAESKAGVAGPVARSPIRPSGAPVLVDGWEHDITPPVCAGLRLCDLSWLAKVSLRASMDGATAAGLAVGRGRAARDAATRRLVVGSGPGEWMVIGPQGQGPAIVAELDERFGSAGELVSVVDLTHGRALVRLSGADAVVGVLSKLCALDFSDRAAPDGTALRSSVASLVTDIVRDDLPATLPTTAPAAGGGPGAGGLAGERSYLLHCERSSGQYLFDALADAGRDHAIAVYGATERDW